MELDRTVRDLIQIQVAAGVGDLPAQLRNDVVRRAARKAAWLGHRLLTGHS